MERKLPTNYPLYDSVYGSEYPTEQYFVVLFDSLPSKYTNNPGAFRSWVNGCAARVEQLQQEIEMQAYQDALNGDGK